MCPVIPTYVPQQPPQPQPPTAVAAPPPSTQSAPSTSTVITNPQTFVVPLGTQPTPGTYSHPQYASMYPPAQYPAAPYYTFPGYAAPPGATFYSPAQPQPQMQPQQQQQQQQQQQPQPPSQTQTTMVSATSAAPGINQGSWSDEETEQLKKFAEQSRSVGTTGEIEWDWVVRQWGSGRTRFVVFFFVSAMSSGS